MERLKGELPKRGWKVVEYGPNTSKNKSIELTADNDKREAQRQDRSFREGWDASLNLMVVSGCYQVPDGEKADRF